MDHPMMEVAILPHYHHNTIEALFNMYEVDNGLLLVQVGMLWLFLDLYLQLLGPIFHLQYQFHSTQAKLEFS